MSKGRASVVKIDMYSKWLSWLFGDDTGSSSKAIWMRVTGVWRHVPKTYWDWPCDDDDFGRCHRLLTRMGWSIEPMRGVSRQWDLLVPQWEELTRLHERKDSDGVYKILRAVSDSDPNTTYLSDCVSMRVLP